MTGDDRRHEAWASDENRFFPVKRAGGFRVRGDGAASTFQLAGAYGQLLDAGGHTKKLSSAQKCPGAVIVADRLPVILEDLGISEPTGNEYVRRWQRLRMAHRCKGAVCLFTAPQDGPNAVCPWARCARRLPTTTRRRNESMRRVATIRRKSRNDSLRAPSTSPGLNGVGVKVSSRDAERRRGSPSPDKSQPVPGAPRSSASNDDTWDADAWEAGEGPTEEAAP